MSSTLSHVIDVTDATFEQVVVEGSRTRPVVVDMWATWCAPCRTLGPILEKVAGERDGAFLLAKLDVDANPGTPAKYGIRGIPTLILFKGGQVAAQKVGALSKSQLTAFLDGHL